MSADANPELLVLGDSVDPTSGVVALGEGGNLFVLQPGSYGKTITQGGDIILNPWIQDSLFRMDTDDYPVLERPGRALVRRLFVTVVRDLGLVQWKITPRIDGQVLLPPQLFTLQAATRPTVSVLPVKLAIACTYIGARIEVVLRQGPARLQGLSVAAVPLAAATPLAGGRART